MLELAPVGVLLLVFHLTAVPYGLALKVSGDPTHSSDLCDDLSTPGPL